MDGTILGQGTFTVGSTVTAQTIQIPSGADWMKVYNYTQFGTAGGASSLGVEFYWQLGMPAGAAMVKYKNNTAPTESLKADTIPSGGFTLLTSAVYNTPAPLIAYTIATSITAANPPVVTTNTLIPAVGSIVRFSNVTGMQQISGIDFTVTANVAATSFTFGNINLLGAAGSGAGVGQYVILPYEPMFYPRHRAITYVRAAAQAVIYLSVTHEYTVGQSVRLSFPGGTAVWGNYAALDGQEVSITAVNLARAGSEPTNGGTANNIQVNFSTAGFPAWNTVFTNATEAYPDNTLVPFTPAQVTPIGEDTATAIASNAAQTPVDYFGNQINGTNTGILADSTVNTTYLGMVLGTGGTGNALSAAITGPAGSAAADVMYWVAGKSTFGGQ